MIERPLRRQWLPESSSALLLLLALLPGLACADAQEAINQARAEVCGVRTPLRENPRLAAMARLLSEGTPMEAAEQRAGYHSVVVVTATLSGVGDQGSIEHLVRELCPRLTTPGLSEIGAYRRGADIWVAVAEPFIAPSPRAAAAITRRVLELTNEARARPRRCGGRWFPAAPPVSLDPQLQEAARAHSLDMAAHGFMAHRGSDGSTPADRVTRTGYPWRLVAENVASGSTTADQVMADWLGSPPHCQNIMDGESRQMGVAFAVNLDTEGGVYWTQVFAAREPPRRR